MTELQQVKEILEELVEHRRGEKGSVMERHAQTIMAGLVTVGIVWMSASISGTNSDVKVLQVQNETLQAQVEDLKNLVSFSTTNYVSRLEFDTHVRDVNRRISVLERHVREDEQGWRNSGPN
jgi:predicted RNase H-like nuclease (RuvC/YqgF family)